MMRRSDVIDFFVREILGGEMSLRTIMIFPMFENMEIINTIREKYDPLAYLVRPHITIVFPFESEISNDKLSKILDNRLFGICPFDIEMCGFTKNSDHSGNYLFLNFIKGDDIVRKIHDALYSNEFKEYDFWGAEYLPHMTVGKLATAEEINDAYEEIQGINEVFKAKVSRISVEMIGENEESIIVLEKELFKPIYRPLEEVSYSEAMEILKSGSLSEKIDLPLRAGEYMIDWKKAQTICIKSFESEEPIVRANAALGLAYIARTKGRLEKHLVKPLIIKELRENEEYRGKILDAISDINWYMEWHLAEKASNNVIKEGYKC